MDVFEKYSFQFKKYNAHSIRYYQDMRYHTGVPYDADFLPIEINGDAVILSADGYGLINPKTGNLVSGHYGNGTITVNIADLPSYGLDSIFEMKKAGLLRKFSYSNGEVIKFVPDGTIWLPNVKAVNQPESENLASKRLEFIGYAYKDVLGVVSILDHKILEDITVANEEA